MTSVGDGKARSDRRFLLVGFTRMVALPSKVQFVAICATPRINPKDREHVFLKDAPSLAPG